MTTDSRKFFEPYKRDACVECGECLVRCPVMSLGRDAAVSEMAALRAGRKGRHVLKRCQSCFACNLVCPKGANPAQLFIDVFHDDILKRGIAGWSRWFHPHEQDNFREYAIARLPAGEKKILSRWEDRTPCEEFVYPGCNLCVTPYITRASFLKDLNIRGGTELCCGEMYYRAGMYEQLRECAGRLNVFFEELGAKRMMILCTAGYNMFTNVLPQFGFESRAEITPYLPWLLERLESGCVPIVKKLDMRVTVHESCYGKTFGAGYYDIPRRILNVLGAEVVEMPHTKECSLCCGIGGGFPAGSGYNPIDISKATLRVVAEAVRTGADAVVTYCSGCLQSISTGMLIYPRKKPVYHLFQMVQMAAGERVEEELNRERAAMMLKGMLLKQSPMLLDARRRK